MSNYVPAMEDVRYEVPGRQLGWRVSQLQAQGYTYQVLRLPGGVYLVIVTQAPEADPFAYQTQRSKPRSRPSIDTGRVLQWALVLAMIGVLVWTAVTVVQGSGGMEGAGKAVQDMAGDAWAWLEGMRLPWDAPAPSGEPVVETTAFRWPWESKIVNAPRAQQGDGWTWPPKNPAGDAIDSAAQVITWLVYALIGVAVLWIIVFVLGMARKVRGK